MLLKYLAILYYNDNRASLEIGKQHDDGQRRDLEFIAVLRAIRSSNNKGLRTTQTPIRPKTTPIPMPHTKATKWSRSRANAVCQVNSTNGLR